MSKQPNSQTQQHSPLFWVKLAVLLVIIFSTVALLTTHLVIDKLKETNRNLQDQALELEDENKDLQNYIDHKDTDEGVKDVAENELTMVDPDTTIYEFD